MDKGEGEGLKTGRNVQTSFMDDPLCKITLTYSLCVKLVLIEVTWNKKGLVLKITIIAPKSTIVLMTK